MATESPIPSRPRRVGRGARSTLTVVLIVLSVVSLTLAPVSIWARNLILDTNGFVSTMGPLAANPVMQGAVVFAVERQVDRHLDVKAYLARVLPPASVQRWSPTLKRATLALVAVVTIKFVRSRQFQQLWDHVIRIAHQQVDNLLAGSTLHGVIKVQSDNVVLDLSQVVSIVKHRLVSAGVGMAARVPIFGATIVIAHIHGFSQIQEGVRGLNTTANLLPWLGLLLAAGALLAARRRRRAGIALALGLAAGMCALGLALLVAEPLFAAPLLARGLDPLGPIVLFNTAVGNLRGALRIILVCALLVAAAIWAARFVPKIRLSPSVWDRVLAPFRTPAAQYVARHARVLRVLVIAIPVVVLVLLDGPPLALVLAFACLVIVGFGLIELCRRAPGQRVPQPIAAD